MNRSPRFWLASAVAVLALYVFGTSWWNNRGLITVHATEKPLGTVVDSIARQGGIRLVTNLDRSSPVTLHFDKVTLPDALDRLAGAADARWSLAYLYGPNKGAIDSGLTAFQSGRLPENWKTFRVSVPDFTEIETGPLDPREIRCTVVAPAEATLHAYLKSFAESADATAAAPEDFNPAVNKPLKQDLTPKVAGTIAQNAKAAMQETFLLSGRRDNDRPPQETAQEEGSGANFSPDRDRSRRANFRGDGSGPGGNPEFMQKRIEQRIALLPPEQQKRVREEYEADRKMWEEIRALPEDQRRAKIEELMNDPARAERMETRREYRDSRRTPEQRVQRFKNYVERKEAQKNQGSN